ncbi:MAG: carboxypeptidase [Flavobacteriales bacterium]|nr:carboxypeptidase [Flavobacteriia bacterium]NCP05609.1 carboxypeptidase [Flavobacteriales bacterium]PIV94685.1 MAG: carboxypeptidase [Flavobacteriaceae bacterium CG17_big_fil_post_rev_8_21_14_2_50_33_15]PIY10857.1 MAG: carboxypeptidase [Flavobacteriaceae bacterium CG_4_10_14_3_um_filter_33_47]PJB20558.1 MAG: carboxypeptidase [Flavobacteriaceae bacterium CG_4_9_14_3_um_filter_33_16]
MKKYLFLFFTLSVCTVFSQNIKIPVDTTVVTSHTLTIKNQLISYLATTGTQPVWNENGEPIATLFYTYYERTKTDKKNRPLIFSFNGGPGSASVWMHIAYTGPKVLNIDEEGYPTQPYGVKDNPNSILDVADIVYVNPVNTAYSRMIADKEGKLPKRETFFGINADIKYLAEWMTTFLSRANRWESPKYIIGESYGGTRVMGLANALQNQQWMYLNGVIMVSPADYKLYSTNQPIYSALNLPYFTAAAWYHKALPADLQNKDLLDILPQVEDYAINKLIPALAKGGFISEQEKQDVAETISYYSGLTKTSILQNNLNVSTSFFWKDLLRHKTGQTIGRLDSRYLGIDKTEAGDSPDYNAELTSWMHSFTPAINYYIREHLNFKTDLKYNMFGDVHPWDNRNDNTREGLRQAMAQNPYLKVLIQSGYYDGATTYFGAKYTMHQVDPSGKMKDRFTFKGYRSGHMMYLRQEDLKSANEDIRAFILSTSYQGKAAKY